MKKQKPTQPNADERKRPLQLSTNLDVSPQFVRDMRVVNKKMARWGNIKLPDTALDSPLVSFDQVAELKADLDSTRESESKTFVRL